MANIWSNIGSGNGFMCDDTKPLPNIGNMP